MGTTCRAEGHGGEVLQRELWHRRPKKIRRVVGVRHVSADDAGVGVRHVSADDAQKFRGRSRVLPGPVGVGRSASTNQSSNFYEDVIVGRNVDLGAAR